MGNFERARLELSFGTQSAGARADNAPLTDCHKHGWIVERLLKHITVIIININNM